MSTFIRIENVTANALIELSENRHETEISFDTLVRYGTQVARILRETSNEDPVLLLSRKYQINMIENYSDFFESDLSCSGQGMSFKLKNTDKQETIENLKKNFRFTMGMQLLEAFTSPDALHELGVTAY